MQEAITTRLDRLCAPEQLLHHKGERQGLTVSEVATYLGVSRQSAYEAVQSKAIASVRLGRRIIVSRSAVEAFLNGGEK